MIQKMGWWLYYPHIGLGLQYPGLFNNDKFVRFFYINKEENFIFIIKEMTTDEKQLSKNLYKFIQFTIPDFNDPIKLKNTSMKIDNFSTNEELWRLVIDNEACDPKYRRHFRLNKILK